jgi:alkylhydroperoxidase family enzyme
MTRIPLIEPNEASPEVQALYRRLFADGANVPNVMKVFAQDPPFLDGAMTMLAALYGDATLVPRHRELAWLRTSQLNACHY